MKFTDRHLQRPGTGAAPLDVEPRPRVRGKFLWLGDRKLYVKGVTYGTFRPREDGTDYPEPAVVERDMAGMAAAGFNTVRTYTPPPRWLLDIAARHGLLVMIGLPWEQHVAFLDDRGRAGSIEARVRRDVAACAGHPAVLCFSIGNEIPASIVRWHGHKRVEGFLHRLYRAVKAEDPGALVTYVNFPTTEYLDLPFLDFCAFNVYLEEEDRLTAYLARLQNVAGDRPLVMAEIGLDSRRNGEQAQADSLRWQLLAAFRAGCAGAMLFAWTDEWHRGGFDIEDWDFGLVRRDRTPKPALGAVRETLATLPVPADFPLPRISVVVCSYNGAETLDETLRGIAALEYPDFETILVDDGSSDATPEIGAAHGVKVISTPNRGLSSARNTGAQAATGEIVAYCDDDAYPDPQWLTYLGISYATSSHVAIGGPNLAPPGDGEVAACVANAPGNPIHVLITDTLAEHIPGCNSSFRREALLAVGGFDPTFRIAGDDVDVCWRLQHQGGTIGFNPAAFVWHHRRGSVRAFWRQQRNYGRAEALLEAKWPDKYNWAGHVSWSGRVYAPGRRILFERWRVYYGTWGSGLFQRLYSGGQPDLATLPLMPEWFLVIGLLAALTALGALWSPLLLVGPLTGVAVLAVLWEAWAGAGRARYAGQPGSWLVRSRMRGRTALLFVLQSYARLYGRIAEGLTPWSRRAGYRLALPRPRTATVWSEGWRSAEDWLQDTEGRIAATGVRVRRGGDFDRWDLEVRGGGIGAARLRMAVEEHGGGKQLLRFRLLPVVRRSATAIATLATALGVAAAVAGSVEPSLSLLGIGLVAALASVLESMGAVQVAREAIACLEPPPAPAAEPAPEAVAPLGRLLAGTRPGEVTAVIAEPPSVRGALADVLAQSYGDTQIRCHPGAGRAVDVEHEPLLPLTVAENIALDRTEATSEQIEDAARAAGAHDFIRRLPRGYETILGTDHSLASDQRVRLALARAFVRGAPVLLVGEPLGAGEGLDRLDSLLAVERLHEGERTLVVTEATAAVRTARRELALGRPAVVERDAALSRD